MGKYKANKEEVIATILGLIKEHAEESVDAASEPQEEPLEEEEVNVDLSTTSLVDKLGLILHETFNSVLVGDLAIESGQELEAMANAVHLREMLRDDCA